MRVGAPHEAEHVVVGIGGELSLLVLKRVEGHGHAGVGGGGHVPKHLSASLDKGVRKKENWEGAREESLSDNPHFQAPDPEICSCLLGMVGFEATEVTRRNGQPRRWRSVTPSLAGSGTGSGGCGRGWIERGWRWIGLDGMGLARE